MCGLCLDLDLNKPNIKDISELPRVTIHTLATGKHSGVIIYFINFVGCKNSIIVMFKGKRSLSLRDFKSMSK